MASCMHFHSGTLRLMPAASAPSASSQRALGSTPASSSSRDSGAPVHSEQETRPWSSPAVAWAGAGAIMPPLLPAHSTKAVRVCIG